MFSLENIKKEYDELLIQLGSPELISDWGKFEELSKKKKELEKIIELEKQIKESQNRIEENKAIISANEDQELISLANTEITQLQEKIKILEKDLAKSLKGEGDEFKDSSSSKDVIVEIRAGTGGDEAAIFAGDLYKMYSKYSQLKGWKLKVLDSNPSGLGGFKEIVFELRDGDIFSKMQWEAGVHRVQRVPATEKSGRIHTSTATVAVLPKPQKMEMKINPADLKVDVYKSSGPGGQYVNKRETAVRITHLPTGLAVASQTERNLLQNKQNAMAILEARLLEKKETEEMQKLGGARRLQIGHAERSEKIRTYNFPQDRVTDHRIKKSFHNIEVIMEGNIDSIIKALQESVS